GVRPVGPVDENANERVVDRPELADGLVGSSEEAGNEVRGASEFAQGGLQLLGGLVDLGAGPLVGLGAVIAGPKHRDFLHGSLLDRKSTRLNSSHEWISYAVFCLKKKPLAQGDHV